MDPDTYAEDYAKIIRYGKDTSPELQHMLKELHYNEDTRLNNKYADKTQRLVLADKLQDHDRDQEAALLRDDHPVKVSGLKLDLGEGGSKYTGGEIKPDYSEFAWPGGAPLIYHHRRGAVSVCPECLNRYAEERAKDLAAGEEPQTEHPKSFIADTHEEGPAFECDDCGKRITSAYGDPDNPDEE